MHTCAPVQAALQLLTQAHLLTPFTPTNSHSSRLMRRRAHVHAHVLAHVQAHGHSNPCAQAMPQGLTHKKASTRKRPRHQQRCTYAHTHIHTRAQHPRTNTHLCTHTGGTSASEYRCWPLEHTQACHREHACTHTLVPSHTQWGPRQSEVPASSCEWGVRGACSEHEAERDAEGLPKHIQRMVCRRPVSFEYFYR